MSTSTLEIQTGKKKKKRKRMNGERLMEGMRMGLRSWSLKKGDI